MKSALLSRYLLLLAAVIFIGVGCKKIKQTENSTTVKYTPGTVAPKPVAGKGGGASLRITPNHDTLNIDSCMLYIKYDAQVVPFDGKYDDSAKALMIQGTPVATFSGLKTGNYYLLAKGWDLVRSQKVRGGLPFIVLEENANTVHSFVLPIQEYE